MQKYKLVVFVPQTDLEKVRIAICNAGAGKLGNYDNCTFMSPGVGTFRPLKGAKPRIGKVGRLERVGEARLETIVLKKDLKKVLAAMKKAHPYEEVAYEVYKLV
ncbi:NGG1p interacting factor NIF3 [candidate division WOR-1 bacterium RIFOXYA12_FULL_43_27]|uniref:NGG1p interacting factor NIF3 n=1 Tax=candidate division WOR-1 bacterium RIFOXYC2_FULL_46_14 TaxID=1802587 RepID=A0A1F4U661_UNCSA|nr:MAG: NGG1p interacting factor NIF3 [candidate division WOR-1 bacterium RIFOXYA12_FULL_43_27]OGC20895.1 MAG: NGG1p interacting factor NIF3 [candidate division WOR-1 bacterium RIFOXYB2_FULL_46_45]OGC31367.1 MAG: NGG1p interacting factor NIF3 [candidate division WOR-1 bacterium RIFOXYA2_FULL_46_56]OGC39773.1 MAG: NGG1p interacting factor NIF3 [candidate division WOR-1 bacterium RIFOXYC2_FULL_46_14]